MVHPYLKRRNGEEQVEYPHPSLRTVLEKTLGVPLFQEQVMRLAIVAADYTPGEADQLRRDMGAWRRTGLIERHRDRIITRMLAKGIAREFAERVFSQILGFGEYGFPESHAASFALIAYATSWLKCHYPAEFACSILNSQPMGFYSPATIVEDSRRHGVVMRPIDIRSSNWDCTLEPCEESAGGFSVRMGLQYVKGLGEREWKKIEDARSASNFTSIEDFVRRVRVDEDVLTGLAEAGAYECFGINRREGLWETLGLANTSGVSLPVSLGRSGPLFDDLSRSEEIAWDYDRSLHSTRGHPLEPLREELRAQGLPDADTIASMKPGRRVRYAGIVICRQRPGTGNGVVFMTLEDETGLVNVILWPKVFERYSLLARTVRCIGVTGKLQSEQGVVHIVADHLWIPQVSSDLVTVPSRDFH
jgi:error-prone DNA polymerase